MISIGQEIIDFEIIGVKPKFNNHEENGESAFETIDKASFQDKWKVIYFYPKDFTFICPTEIVEFANLNQEFMDRDCIVLGGSTDNEFCKLAWRREHPDLKSLKDNALEETKEFIEEELMEDAYGAYSIMSMNAIYYRFTHLSSENDYFNMPANLRMQYLSKFKIDKSDFEMLCLAVAIIIGCGKCINAHENILRENNISKLHIQNVARIASIVNSIANVIRVIN